VAGLPRRQVLSASWVGKRDPSREENLKGQLAAGIALYRASGQVTANGSVWRRFDVLTENPSLVRT